MEVDHSNSCSIALSIAAAGVAGKVSERAGNSHCKIMRCGAMERYGESFGSVAPGSSSKYWRNLAIVAESSASSRY